jgi:hypothetical protein
VLAVVRQRRGEEDLPATAPLGEQRLRELPGALELRDLRQVLRLHRLAPLITQLVERQAELALERPLDADVRHGVHDLTDGLVTPAPSDVLPEGVAVPVREVAIGALGHLPDRRQEAVDCRVAHPRVGERVVGPEREVLGHPLGEPVRGHVLGERLQVVPRLSAREDVVLELVHHLVREEVLQVPVVALEVEDVALAERVGHALGALAEVTGDVVLPEVAPRGEDDDRLLLAELVTEDARQARVAALRHARRVDRGNPLLGVVVHEKVLGLEHLPVESIVLHLILPEIALGLEPRPHQRRTSHQCNRRRPRPHVSHLSAP